MLVPNEGRVIVEFLKEKEKEGQIILPNRENATAGENLIPARIVNPGDSGLKKGTLIALGEYSIMGIYPDLKAIEAGTVSRSAIEDAKNQLHIVSKHDIIAYEDDA